MPKKVEVDQDVCIGCGLCASTCEDCFGIGPDGKAHYKNPDNTSCDLVEIAENCPVQAISVKDEE